MRNLHTMALLASILTFGLPERRASADATTAPTTRPSATSKPTLTTQATKATPRPTPPLSEVDILWHLDQWEIRERAALVTQALWEWRKYTREPELSTKPAYEALEKIRAEKPIFAILLEARKTAKDPTLRKRVEMLWEGLREYHLSAEVNKLRKEIYTLSDKLNGIQASFRGTYRGKKLSNRDLSDLIRKSSDPKIREDAWRAYAAVGDEVLKGGFMKMIRLRNEYAKHLGFPTFFHYSYHKLHLKPDVLWALYEDLRKKTELPAKRVLASWMNELSSNKIFPWDRTYAPYALAKKVVDLDTFFPPQKLEGLLYQVFGEMGFDLRSMDIEMDLYPRPKKNQHAYCFDIDAPYDVRILANLGTPGERAYETLLHEMGHAVHAKGVLQNHRTFRGLPDEGFLNEGSANFFGNLVNSKAFYQTYLGLTPAQLKDVTALQKNKLDERLYHIRWILLWMYFERDLYENDKTEDPSPQFWKRFAQFQGDIPPVPPPFWGVLIHFVSHPIYYQNYLLADLLAAQLHEAVKTKTGQTTILKNPKVAAFLRKEFFAHGRRYRWDELLQRITGKPLTADAYLRSLKDAWD